MSRNRLTDKTAAEAEGNDLYTMNGARPTGNINPGTKYDIGGPAEFGETPITQAETKAIHDQDVKDRDPDTNIPELRKASEQAIRNAAELERKAIRCLVASQRMLPGAEQHVIEANAADLIRLPLASIDAILSRQESFARRVASEAEALEGAEDANKNPFATKAEDGQVPAPTAAPIVPVTADPGMPAPVAPVAAAPVAPAFGAPVAPAVDPMVNPADATPADQAAAMDPMQMMAHLASQMSALQAHFAGEKGVNPFAPAEKKCDDDADADDKTGCVKTASSLDAVFAAAQAPASKKGVTSLSGMVRQASAAPATSSLESLWVSAPDVSGLF